MIMAVLITSKSSCLKFPGNGINLGFLVDLLGFSNVEIFCDSWSKGDFDVFVPGNLNRTVGYNPYSPRHVIRQKSIIICLDGNNQTAKDLMAEFDPLQPSLVLYELEDALEVLKSISISMETDFFLLNTRTFELQDVYDLNGERWNNTLGFADPQNDTGILALKDRLDGLL